MITSDEYYSSLRSIGISDAVAWATTEIEIARRIAQTEKTAIRASAQAATRTQAAKQRLYREQYRAGVIDAGTYYNDLVIAGVIPEEARAIVDTEVTRAQAAILEAGASQIRAEETRTQAAYVRLYRDQYRAYQIDANRYYDNLIILGISPERATAVVQDEVVQRQAELERLEDQETEATQRAAQRAQARLLSSKYDAGLIDADGYLAGLLEIGTDPDLAWATVELADVDRYDLVNRAELKAQEKEDLAAQRAQAQLYTRRYRAGEINERDLYAHLVAVGIPEILAAVTVELEADQRQLEADRVREQLIIPSIKRAWSLFAKALETQFAAGDLTLDQYVDELVFSGLDQEIAEIIAHAERRIRES